MKITFAVFAALLGSLALAGEAPRVPDQSGLEPKVVLNSLDSMEWRPIVNMPPGGMVSVLSEDASTHGVEVLVRLPSAYKVAPHWHKHSEFFLIVKGRLNLKVGAKEVELGPGDTLSLPPNLVHSFQTARFKDCVFFLKTDGPVGFTYVNPEDRAR